MAEIGIIGMFQPCMTKKHTVWDERAKKHLVLPGAVMSSGNQNNFPKRSKRRLSSFELSCRSGDILVCCWKLPSSNLDVIECWWSFLMSWRRGETEASTKTIRPINWQSIHILISSFSNGYQPAQTLKKEASVWKIKCVTVESWKRQRRVASYSNRPR